MAAAVRPRKASGAKPVALVGTTQAPSDAAVQEPRVIMYTRRARLGVGGKVCMLTGKRKYAGIHRSFSEKKNFRYWRPCTFWKKIWWDKEQKWVRLYVSAYALKRCDRFGLEHMANKAGLDLYAWCREHWEPGSRQPLPLKVGWTNAAKEAKKYWPQYKKYLNKGKALADIFPAPTFEGGPLCLRKMDVANGGKPLQEGKKPPKPKTCKRLLVGSSAWKAANGV